MTTIFHYDAAAHRMDRNMWQWVDKTVCDHPHIARLLALPVAIETLAKGILFAPGCILDTIFTSLNFAKNILLLRTNGTVRRWMGIDARNMWWHSVLYAGCFPLFSLHAVVNSIRVLCHLILIPRKTVKVQIARASLSDFIYELSTTPEATSQDTVSLPLLDKKILLPFSPSCAGIRRFVRGAFKRFKKEVAQARTDDALSALHFIDTKEARERLKEEVMLKRAKTKEVHEQGYLDQRLIIEKDIVASKAEKGRCYEELNSKWIGFQKKIAQAKTDELAFLRFDPEVEKSLVNAAENTFRRSSRRASLEKIEAVRAMRVELPGLIHEHVPAGFSNDIPVFAQATLERFKNTVLLTQRNEEIERASQQLKNEVLSKFAKIKEAYEQEYLVQKQKILADLIALDKEGCCKQLEKAWISFQQKVTRAKIDELTSLKFEFDSEKVLSSAFSITCTFVDGEFVKENQEKVQAEYVLLRQFVQKYLMTDEIKGVDPSSPVRVCLAEFLKTAFEHFAKNVYRWSIQETRGYFLVGTEEAEKLFLKKCNKFREAEKKAGSMLPSPKTNWQEHPLYKDLLPAFTQKVIKATVFEIKYIRFADVLEDAGF